MKSTQVKLESAANGLLMMGESDYPFTWFETPVEQLDEQLILQLAEKPEGSAIEKTDLDHLLRNMTNISSGAVNQETANKFSNLSSGIKEELTNVVVYRVGEIQIEVLITGITKEGKIAGMRTQLIET